MRESALNISIEMGDLVRGKLREAVGSFGRSAFQEPRRCEAILRDSCPEAPREVFLLVSALRENVALELESGSATMPESALTAKLTRRLSENLGLSADAARWAVESWRYALDDNPGLQGDGRGTRSTAMPDSDPGFAPRGVTSEHPASTVNWPWLGMCFVALTSAAAALAAVGWLTFVHPWTTWPGGLLELCRPCGSARRSPLRPTAVRAILLADGASQSSVARSREGGVCIAPRGARPGLDAAGPGAPAGGMGHGMVARTARRGRSSRRRVPCDSIAGIPMSGRLRLLLGAQPYLYPGQHRLLNAAPALICYGTRQESSPRPCSVRRSCRWQCEPRPRTRHALSTIVCFATSQRVS